MTLADFEKNAELPAPGVCDDGSGTAAVMELARVMSQYEFDKTHRLRHLRRRRAGPDRQFPAGREGEERKPGDRSGAEQRHHRHRHGRQRTHGQRSGEHLQRRDDGFGFAAIVALRARGRRALPALHEDQHRFHGGPPGPRRRPHSVPMGRLRGGARLHAERNLRQPASRHGHAGQHVGAVHREGGESEPGGGGEPGARAEAAHRDAGTARRRRPAGRRRTGTRRGARRARAAAGGGPRR